jgi:FkbM family methyltransferase
LGLLKRFLNQPDAEEALPTKTITIAGHDEQICGSPTDGYFEHLQGQANENAFLERVVSENLSSDATIFDVGANIGLTTAMLAKHAPNGTVTSFEPSPVAFRYLKGTVAANNLKNVKVVNVAIGSSEGELPFSDNPQSATASHLNIDGSLGETTHTVSVQRLDDIAPQYAPQKLDFIKIDVEGHERGVLEGGMATIKSRQPLVFMEFNSFTLLAYGNQNPRAFLECLQTLFSDIQFYDAGVVKHINTKTELLHFIHTNLISHHCVSDLLCIP